MSAKSRVLCIIVNYNGGQWVVDAVGSLLAQDFPADVLVIDNSSTDSSVADLRAAYPGLSVIETGQNLGSVRGYNYALRYPDYDYYVFFNPDALAEPTAIGRLVAMMDARPNLAVLGPTIVEYDKPNIVQAFDPRNDFLLFPFDRWEGRPTSELPDVDYFDAGFACAAAVICRGDVFRRLGGMEELFFMFVEEPEYCWRARLLGYDVAVTPRVKVRHFGGVAAAVGNEGGNYVTSLRRLYFRERNSLIMGMKCYAAATLALYLILLTMTLSLESLALVVLGRAKIARTYYEAVRDALRVLPTILKERRIIQRERVVSERVILSKLTPGYAKIASLRKRGIPIIKDWQRSPT